jgi:hypothetical protein
LSSKVGARIPITFSHSFFCERDIELGELRLSFSLRTSSPGSFRGKEAKEE